MGIALDGMLNNFNRLASKKIDPIIALCESEIEKMLLYYLLDTNYSFEYLCRGEDIIGVKYHYETIKVQIIPQYKEVFYRLDFAVFVESNGRSNKLCLECDGYAWHSSAAQKQKDHEREQYLNELGWETLRYTGDEIQNSYLRCVYKFYNKIGLLVA